MASSPNDQEKTTYGDYEIVKPIGKGKFAVVYRAKRISNDEVVALKRINVDSIDDKARDKTLKEVGFLQSLDHPNIIKYLDSFINDNDLVIVFEWAAAGDLKRQVRKAQERGVGFEERVIWKYFSQICNAIQHMHERRIMHRDLKPANIFLTLDGTVKVGDLGLSREMSENTIQAHSKVGTPLYMSPEVLKGDGYDFKSDIWSLGCILYELAMLKSPFKAEGLNLYSLFQKISKGDYLPLPEQYSDELKDLAYKMISTSSEDRPEIGPSCELAQEMRSIYSDKQKAAKRQAEAQTRVEEKKRRDEQEQADAERGSKDNADREADGKHRGDADAVQAKGGQEKQTGGLDDGEGGYVPSQPRAQARPSSRDADGASDKPATAHAADMGKDRGDKNWTGAQYGRNGSSSSSQRGGAERVSAHQDQERQRSAAPQDGWASQGQGQGQGHVMARDQRWEAAGADPKGQRGSDVSDPGYQSPPDFERDEPVKTRAGAPKVTRRARNSPSSSRGPGGRASVAAEGGGGGPDSPESPWDARAGRGGGNSSGRAFRDQDDRDSPNRRIDFDTVSRVSQAAVAAGGQRGARGDDVLNAIKNGFVAFALSDAIYQKLVVLGCPLDDNLSGVPGKHRKPNGHGRLLPVHFAVDLNTLGGVAGYKHGGQGEQFFQFRRLTEISIWLLLKIGGRSAQLASALDVDASSPTMIAKQLLMMGSEAGLDDEALSQVTPTSLVTGYGEQACIFLNALVDKCATTTAHGAKRLVYPPADSADDEGNDDDVLPEGDDDEEEEVEEEEVDLGFLGSGVVESPFKSGAVDRYADAAAREPDGHTDRAGHGWSGEEGPLSPSRAGGGHSILVSAVDAQEWAQETERVAPALARARQRALGGGGGGWAEQLERLRAYNTRFGDPAGNSNSNSNSGNAAADASVAAIMRDVTALQRSVNNARERVLKAEAMVNVKSHLSRLSSEYGSYKGELGRLEGQVEERTAKIASLGDSLATVSDRLAEVKEEMDDKHGHVSGGVGADGDSGAGTHQVIRYRAAVQRMKEDVNAISLSVGMAEVLLMTKRQQHSRDRQSERSKRAAARRGRGNGRGSEEKSALD